VMSVTLRKGFCEGQPDSRHYRQRKDLLRLISGSAKTGVFGHGSSYSGHPIVGQAWSMGLVGAREGRATVTNFIPALAAQAYGVITFAATGFGALPSSTASSHGWNLPHNARTVPCN
jgi:hypothetical protein